MFSGKVISNVTGMENTGKEFAVIAVKVPSIGESFSTEIVGMLNKTVYIGEDRRFDRVEGPGFERLHSNINKVSSEAIRICREINLDVGINGVVKIGRDSRLAERIKNVAEGNV